MLIVGATLISRTATTSRANCLILQALVVLVYISSTFTAKTIEQLQDSFDVEMRPRFGGTCNRNRESDNQPMLPKVLAAFEDAWLLSSSAVEMPPVQIAARSHSVPSARNFTRLRVLLLIFFGIRVSSTGQFDAQNLRAFSTLLSKLINPLSFNK